MVKYMIFLVNTKTNYYLYIIIKTTIKHNNKMQTIIVTLDVNQFEREELNNFNGMTFSSHKDAADYLYILLSDISGSYCTYSLDEFIDEFNDGMSTELWIGKIFVRES